MKRYRCVFVYAHGRTSMEIAAPDAEQALIKAADTAQEEAASVEVWDETGLVLQRKGWHPVLKSSPNDPQLNGLLARALAGAPPACADTESRKGAHGTVGFRGLARHAMRSELRRSDRPSH